MTQEDKELLLKDLCARLPYGVMIYLHTSSEITGSIIVLNSSIYGFIEDVLNNSPYEIKEVKPYLRPMSSMTQDDIDEYNAGLISKHFVPYFRTDWLDKKMFDYRELIPKGLALEAPEGMYNFTR